MSWLLKKIFGDPPRRLTPAQLQELSWEERFDRIPF